MDFEADLTDKMQTLIINFPYITEVKYCKKLDFEAGLINK